MSDSESEQNHKKFKYTHRAQVMNLFQKFL